MSCKELCYVLLLIQIILIPIPISILIIATMKIKEKISNQLYMHSLIDSDLEKGYKFYIHLSNKNILNDIFNKSSRPSKC
jgi:hypothetical protein